MNLRTLLSLSAILATSSVGRGQELFSDDFNNDSSADYTVLTSSADTEVQFAFDYSTVGIPAAPNTTDATTLGLRMAANLADGSTAAVTLATLTQFTGNYSVSFDAWVNANGPFPGGGAGSTEYITGGVGGDGATVNLNGTSGSGAWVAASGEGGSSRDYRMYKLDGEQFPASGQFVAGQNNTDVHFSNFGGIDVGALPVQGAIPQQTGSVSVGSFGFAWRRIDLVVDSTGGTGGATSVRWSIDGLQVGTLDAGIGASFPTDGSAVIGYMDPFSSLSDNSQLSFGLIDNLVVSVAQAGTIRVTQPENFAILNVDSDTSTVAFEVENRNDVPLTVNEVNFSGADAASFSLATALPVVIAADSTATIDITFTATGATGTKVAQVEFVSTDPQDPSLILGLDAVYAEALLAHYKLDETAGNTMVEATGNGPDGAFIIRANSLSYAQTALSTGTSLGFVAADAPDAGCLALSSVLHVPTTSISMWIQPNGGSGEDTLFNRDPGFTGADAIYGCFIDALGVLTYRAGGDVILQSANGAIVDSQTYHVVITHLDDDGFGNATATRARMYINGVMVDENTSPTGFDAYSSSAATQSLYIASRTAAGSGFDGLIDDIQIYSIEITPSQAANMFTGPGLTAFDDIPELRFSDVSYDMAADTVMLTWDSLPGKFYLLEGTSNLQPAPGLINWTELDDSISSQGTSTSYEVQGVTGPLNFYRVIEQ